MEIKPQTINLYKTDTWLRQKEQNAVLEILGQIRGWLEKENLTNIILRNRSSSILINKLVYFSSVNISKKNQKLQISGGWYKYGPCYDLGRRSEESLSLEMFDKLKPKQDILSEITQTCEEHVPIFLESIGRNNFPYAYLTFIYSKKWEYGWLKDYYITKNNLEILLRKAKPKIKKDDINKCFMEFDMSITNSKYHHQIEIPDDIINKILSFTSLLGELYSNQTNLNQDLMLAMKNYFTENILMIFSYKNYKKTFHTPNQNFKSIIIQNMQDNYEQFVKDLDDKLKLFYDLYQLQS